MLKLKPNCSVISYKAMEKTKDNYIIVMYGVTPMEEIDAEIKKNQQYAEQEGQESEQFVQQVGYLKRLKANKDYVEGNIPRGIEKIIEQIIESYAFVDSLKSNHSSALLSAESYFFNLVNVSTTFMISCELAKLFQTDERDFTLANIWNDHADVISEANITDDKEIEYISRQFSSSASQRDSSIQTFLKFRNKSISHNKRDVPITWEDFFQTMKFIVRVWGLLDAYHSPNCFPRPIYLDEQLYTPLGTICSYKELTKMKEHRLARMKELFKAASQNLVSGKTDDIKPFGEFKMTATFTIHSSDGTPSMTL